MYVGPPFLTVKLFSKCGQAVGSQEAVTIKSSVMDGCGLGYNFVEDGCKGTCVKYIWGLKLQIT